MADAPDKFRILAADSLAQRGLDFLDGQEDCALTSAGKIDEDELVRIVPEFDGMIVRSGTRVTARVLAAAKRLKAVVRAGVGVDNIDLPAATASGVLVMNSAEASTITTAEHAFALMLGLARHISPACRMMADGGWERNRFQGAQLSGKTLGIVGFGRIGQTIASRALAFNMRVVAYDPVFNAATAMDGQVKMVDAVADLWPEADVITFHVPLSDQTRYLLNRESFGRCRPGVLIVNASRGGVVNEKDLLEAIDDGRCGGAALDVFEAEPPAVDSPLRRHDRVLVTPHLGASTVEAQDAVTIDSASALLDYLRGKAARGAVNVTGLRLDLDPLQSRYADLAGRMAVLLSPMIAGSLSGVTIDLGGHALTAAAATIERMALIGLLQSHFDTTLNVVNVRHIAENRGLNLRAITSDEEKADAPRMAIEVDAADRGQRIVGRVYSDLRPRVVEINGYHMDIVPAGDMVLIRNDDRPGVIGLVGNEFGNAGINIADMAISRRGDKALMLLRVDERPPDDLTESLSRHDGIDKVAIVSLPPEE